MAQEFEGDLADAVFWGADMSRALFRDVNLTGARLSHAWLVDVQIDALVDRLVINGVDVTDFVNQRDRWYPLRAMIRPETPEGMREAWVALQGEWNALLAQAEALPPPAVDESVDGEFTLVETLRHLTFAMDKWFTVPVAGGALHPTGLPNRGSMEYGWDGLDFSSAPSYAEALTVRREQGARFADFLAQVSTERLTDEVDVPENGHVTLDECVYTVLEEEFWHLRYASRDLATLTARAGDRDE